MQRNYLTIILNAPRGVTSTAGANAYATKFAISPIITKITITGKERFYKKSMGNKIKEFSIGTVINWTLQPNRYILN